MCTQVKKLGVNMQQQVPHVLRALFDFINFKLSKVHNMVALMFDLWFKDSNLMGDYVGHLSVIEIVAAQDKEFLLLTLKTLYQKHHGCSNAFSIIVQKTMHNINVVSGVGVSEDETCFEQVSVVSFTYLQNIVS